MASCFISASVILWSPPSGATIPFKFCFLVDGLGVQSLPGSNLKSSPYFSTAHASRAFFAAIATTARHNQRLGYRLLIA
jgi:hypothetical protein